MSALEIEPTVLLPNLPSSASTSINAASRAYLTTNFKSSKFWSVAASVAAVMFVSVIVLQQQLSAPPEIAAQQVAAKAVETPLEPVAIAQSIPTEYLQAHQAAAPSSAAYYTQNASYTGLDK